jgi:hypothetical protein
MTTVKTTITTIERGIRTTSKSRSCSPVEHVKHQLHAFVDHSNTEKLELGKLNNNGHLLEQSKTFRTREYTFNA